MGIFDEIKKAVDDNEQAIESAIDKAGDLVDEKTDGKYAAHVDRAQDALKNQVGQPNN
ncbi:MAG: antitoxin [Nigerium sp.]|nr:antitoxin [Nigerium sp.]